MRTRIGVAIVGVLAVIAIIAGVAAKKLQGPPPIVITDPQAPSTLSSSLSSPASASTQSQPGTIYVHVAGAVKSPALYQLNPGTRLFQALKAAGGPKADADLDAVNLAEKLSDGEKVYVPTREEMKSPDALALAGAQNDIGEHSVIPNVGETAGGKKSGRASSSGHANKLTSPSQGTVDINTADAEELQRLPGVGPAMAARILAFRQSAGRFRKIEDLMEVSGIGPKKFAKMKQFVRV